MIGRALKLFNRAYEPWMKDYLKKYFGVGWEQKVREYINKMDTSNTDYASNIPIVYDTQMILFLLTRRAFYIISTLTISNSLERRI